MLDTVSAVFAMLLTPLCETILMVAGTTFFSILLGLPLGVVLNLTDPVGLKPRRMLNNVLSRVVNLLRSFPFLILMILVFPLSRLIVGESTGTKATIVPLAIAASPFVARVIESALKEIDPQVLLAARVMGSSTWQIVYKVMIPEAMPSIVAGITLTVINIIGYSAMAGAIGGGGLGDLAIRYGYHRFRTDVMIGAVLVIVVLVEAVQLLGSWISDRMIKKR
ncbi:ABC transporter permease [Fibrobacterales bacterium]|nr:ABC transporter permease [Fibrobacterales bacterium]